MLVFLDESGNHNLDRTKFDNFYNLFVLWAVCFSDENYRIFDAAFRSLKVKYFTDDSYIIHTQEITRPNRSKDFRSRQFNDPDFRASFYNDLNILIEQTEFSIVCCVIEKEKLLEKYVRPADPYHFSFENIINRTFRHSQGELIDFYPEHRDNNEDRLLEIALLEMKITGTRFYSGRVIAEKIRNFRLTQKDENMSWSQLIDLVVTPIGRHFLGKTPRVGNEVDYEVLKKKIKKSDDLTLFP
jgi:hypothetical protein